MIGLKTGVRAVLEGIFARLELGSVYRSNAQAKAKAVAIQVLKDAQAIAKNTHAGDRYHIQIPASQQNVEYTELMFALTRLAPDYGVNFKSMHNFCVNFVT